jgi:HKD family nuclease
MHMPVVYNQALAHRFGTAIVGLLDGGQWKRLDVAVAWVRRSGTRHLMPALRRFLAQGHVARFVVGIDIENTSVEGLEDLLTLSAAGAITTFIHHNESPAITFHPKVYLLTGDSSARLIVGSNNVTEAGLFTNTEAGLQIDSTPNAQVIRDIRTAIDSWCDTTENLAKELDRQLLHDLIARGYVLPENVLANRRRTSESTARASARRERRQEPLFGTKHMAAPPPPEPGSSRHKIPRMRRSSSATRVRGELIIRGNPALTITNVLLMRIRPARGTQVQIPIPLRQSAFFAGQNEIASGHDHARRRISETRPARARGNVNTYKVEIPECRGMATPVLRLERTAAGIIYYAYEATSTLGQPILDALQAGRTESPPSTALTKPSDPDHSTWYRFI